ncbi:hypothetical protein PR202_gb01245 [Eleusine coracana subsp. coracana]|uniref:HAT C-terminal dimerisation domain-containing protein n=1 Tax=Eleusine coracana subsp. coracana TaxID=191504 RepID=A0AAV5DVF4_ELECO|nr:hypothetical protein PR202_gb01245 [Eleusine coracana subsp. coracana]
MVMSDQWSAYKKDNIGQAEIVRKKLLDEFWWDQIDYILAFTEPIYSMIRLVDTEKSCLHLIYEMWNNMIEKVKAAIYKHEGKAPEEESAFYSVVHADDLKTVKEEYAEFTHLGIEYFSMDSIIDRDILDPKTWWVTHGASVPKLQSLALKLLSLPASSSCYERNWSTYSLIHKIMKSKSRPVWASDLVFVQTNLRLQARTLDEYYTHSESWLWDVEKDCFVANLVAGVLEFATLSLDEPEFELAMMEEAERNDDDRV